MHPNLPAWRICACLAAQRLERPWVADPQRNSVLPSAVAVWLFNLSYANTLIVTVWCAHVWNATVKHSPRTSQCSKPVQGASSEGGSTPARQAGVPTAICAREDPATIMQTAVQTRERGTCTGISGTQIKGLSSIYSLAWPRAPPRAWG